MSATLPELLRTRVADAPRRLQYRSIDTEEPLELTVGEVAEHAAHVAAGLASVHDPGERIVLLLPAGLAFVAGFLGTVVAGAVAVPVAPPGRSRLRAGLEPLRRVAADCAPAAVVTTASIAAALTEATDDDDPVRALPVHRIEDLLRSSGPTPTPAIGPADPAYLQYTSGSTASPRGVVVTHGNVTTNAAAIAAAYRTTPDDHAVVWVPPHHDMGLVGGLLVPLHGSFSISLLSPQRFLQSPVRWLRAISDERVTISGGPDFAFRLACDRVRDQDLEGIDLSAWRVAFTGAEPVSAHTLETFARRHRSRGFDHRAFYPCYGLAESTLMATGGDVDRAPVVHEVDRTELERTGRATPAGPTGGRRLVGCGRTAGGPGSRLAIVDPADARPLDDGVVGEIWLQGPSVADGYFGDPGRTRELFGAHLADGDGPWLRTGDLGFVHDGELFVTGRRKDVIVSHGRNLDASDVEDAVQQAVDVPRMGMTAAVSVVDDDGRERFAIVQEVGRSGAEPAQVRADIQHAVADRFALRADEVVLVVHGSLPRTTSGKLRRAETARLLAAGALAVREDER